MYTIPLAFSLHVSTTTTGARPGATIRNRDELCHAVKKEDVDEVRSLLTMAAPDLDVNVRDEVKYCAFLHFAVYFDCILRNNLIFRMGTQLSF